jgi:hypothetical protein
MKIEKIQNARGICKSGAGKPHKSNDLTTYRNDPLGYIRTVLGVTLTPDQEAIVRACLEAPWRIKIRAGHNVGKTFLLACVCCWWYDTRPVSVVITTAPTLRDVVDLLWTEIRLLRERAGLPMDFIGPAAPEMRSSPDHWAKGYTASKGESFQGRHRESMLFLFDEDDGLPSTYFDRTRTMFLPGGDHLWVSIGNPYSTSSPSCLEESAVGPDGQPAWRLFSLDATRHPNVLAELAGETPPIPNAVSLGQIRSQIAETCQPIDPSDRKDTDFEFPVGSGLWYRPGPVAEAGMLGRRPSAGVQSVWSESAFAAACVQSNTNPDDLVRSGKLPVIGVDVAVYGVDYSTIHSRVGPVSLRHRSANGWGPEELAGAIKQECQRLAEWANSLRAPQAEKVKASEIPVVIERDGYGEGVLSHGRDWNWSGVSAAGTACDPEQYRNQRSELWFRTAKLARDGLLDLSRLDRTTIARLRQQCLAPAYELDGQGRHVVEPKDDTKKKLKRSPDDADALNIAYSEVGGSSDVATLIPMPDRQARNGYGVR